MTLDKEVEVLDQFPVGMRVLAVDDDQTCLRILQTLLHRCQYHVTTTNQAQNALELLRENKNKFDLVISDVDMPDMDGFKLLELVGLEMDLPVIMLSSHSDPSYVMKGVKHGACDYLLKPVRIEELKNIWQHVVRKSKLKKNKSNVSNGGDNDGKANRKRKDQYYEEEEEDERGNENDDPTAQKKPRIMWTRELHNKFLVAVDHLGVEKAVPKKILDLMNVDKLTRENVASHLQKFRVALKKMSDEANQQANRAAIDSHLMQMSSLKGLGGFHHHRPIHVGSGHFHGGATTMRHFSSLGRLNSPTGGMFQPVSSSFPRNHNGGGNILQGLPLEKLHINNNNIKSLQSFTSQQGSLMAAAPNNLLLLEGSSSSPSLNSGFSPHFEINKRLEHWSNNVLSTNIPQSDVHSKPDALEWTSFYDSATPLVNQNVDTNPTSFCRNTDFGSSNAAAQIEFFYPLQMNQQQPGNNSGTMTEAQLFRSSNAKEGLVMGQQKLQSGFMASDAGSLDDIVHSLMTQEQSPSDFSEEDWNLDGLAHSEQAYEKMFFPFSLST